MKFKLATQLYILIFLIVIVALSINSYFDYKNIKQNYLLQAYLDSQLDIDVVKSNIKKEQINLELLLKKIVEDKSIANSLNLISNYQNIDEYNSILFDEEKKNLLSSLETKINTLGSYSFVIFDKTKDLVVINSDISSTQKVKGFITYENSKKFFYDSLKKEKRKNIYNYGLNEDILNSTKVKLEEKAFSLIFLKPIYLEDKLVGYIKAKKRFSNENIQTLLHNVNNSFSFLLDNTLLGTLKSKNTSFILKNADSFEKELHNFNEMFNDNQYFYHAHYIKTLNGNKLYFISGTNKNILDEKILALFKEFSISFIISICISFILAFIFVKNSISTPLEKLMTGIKELKKGNYISIDLKAKNELKDISVEFNELTTELENSFLKNREINKFLENIIDTVPVRIFWKDKNGVYLGANRLFLEDSGLKSKDDLIGKSDFELPWSDFEAEKYRKDDLEVINNKKERYLIEETQTDLNGNVMYLLTSKVPLKNLDGEIIGVLGVYEDITKQKRIEKELKDKDMILFEQSKLAAMGEMLENIAHQWRQPLSMITTSATGVLLGKEMDMLTDKVLVESLNNITSSAKYLSSTIDDFRNFYKTDNEKELFDIKNCLIKSKTLLSSKFKNRDITFIVDMESILVRGYENELIQVFMNILNNAKDALENVSNKKVIIVSSTVINDTAFVSIKDSAGGIPKDILPRIFDHKFTTKQDSNGTGIGLYMSKLIMKKAKGKLYAKNSNFDYENESFFGAEFIVEMVVSKE